MLCWATISDSSGDLRPTDTPQLAGMAAHPLRAVGIITDVVRGSDLGFTSSSTQGQDRQENDIHGAIPLEFTGRAAQTNCTVVFFGPPGPQIKSPR